MNINEVYMLSHNLREFYRGYPHPYIQIGSHRWYLFKGKATERSFLMTIQQSAEYLFNWVIG